MLGGPWRRCTAPKPASSQYKGRHSSRKTTYLFAHRGCSTDIGVDGSSVSHGPVTRSISIELPLYSISNSLNDVTTSGFTLTPDHTRSLRDSTKSLSEVLGSTNERHLEWVLRDVVLVVGHGENLTLCEITLLVSSGFDAQFTYHRCSQHQRLAGSEPRPVEDLGKLSKFCAQ